VDEILSKSVNFNLMQWVNKSILAAARMKATEIHYERGKDGLTVQVRKGTGEDRRGTLPDFRP